MQYQQVSAKKSIPLQSFYLVSLFQGYAAAVSRHTVKKFLLLVFFLDYAKTSRLIEHDPCLFCKDAEIKVEWLTLFRFFPSPFLV